MMPEYIFCYDISDVKRLRKAAKILQGQALRIQKSVYLLVGTPTTMHRCWQQLSDCVDAKKDDLRCYTIPAHSPMQSLGANVLQEGIVWSGLMEKNKTR
jgi:CRISPR-associated protein Cas2